MNLHQRHFRRTLCSHFSQSRNYSFFVADDKIIAFGFSTITIWDSQTGNITCKIDTNSPIQDNLCFFSLNENVSIDEG